jgi:hypothetical protein
LRFTSLPPLTKGPNQSCPDPIVPLTNDRSALISAINLLSHWDGSGTVSSEGLMWGWRVLEPSAGTFQQGKPKGQASKVVVLMTDGMNMAAEQASWATFTDYTAYGYLQFGRIADGTYQGYRDYQNARLELACTNAKQDGIKIYTVTFGVTDAATTELYERCASGPPYAYSTSTASDLGRAFADIAASLSEIRLYQ